MSKRHNGPVIEAILLELGLRENRRGAGVGAVEYLLPLIASLCLEDLGEQLSQRGPRGGIVSLARQIGRFQRKAF